MLPSFVNESFDGLRRMNIRQVQFCVACIIFQVLLQFLNFTTIILTAYMMWKGLSVVFNNESPVVVVLSASMSPAFKRGDILFLTNTRSDPIVVGNICVFNIKGRDIPIVHRVIKVHKR